MGRRFANACQDFCRGGEIRERFANMAPALPAIGLHQQTSVQRDVPSFHSRTGVDQAIGPNYPGAGIAQDDELAVDHLLPHGTRVLAVVNTDGYKTGVEGIELFYVLRELAQLARAIRSPIPAIKDQQDAFASEGRQVKASAFLVL